MSIYLSPLERCATGRSLAAGCSDFHLVNIHPNPAFNMEDASHSRQLIYGVLHDEFLDFIPEDVAELQMLRWKILREAKTWGEVYAMASPQILAELLAQTDHSLGASLARLHQRRMNDGFHIDELNGAGIRIPEESEPFNANHFFDPIIYPPCVGCIQLEFIPGWIQERWGKIEHDFYGATWLKLEPADEAEIVAALASEGYSCSRDDDRIYELNGGDHIICGPMNKPEA